MKYKILHKTILQTLVLVFVSCYTYAQFNAPLRRPVSPNNPMWLIHIDTWNYPDPQKIIDLVPKDIRPYVVMNISLSVSHDSETGQFSRAEYGYEIAQSWLRTCAENRMWAMIQPSSGAYSHLPDNDMTIYEELYNEYPNLIGFNYCEQSWGYGDDDPLATNWDDRMAHFAKLLELNDKYGTYLVVSWCGNKWIPSINPIAMLKRKADFKNACAQYTQNYILCEKYTFKAYQSDMESICLGSYLSGFSGQYGIRYDDSGWSDGEGNVNENFTMATYGAPFLEHVMLTGQTVIDAPELIWTHCFQEGDPVSTTDGYTTRNWETFPEFDKVSVDLFRKVLDGTVRIPTRQEVIDRTKMVVVNDVNSGNDDDKYSSPETLFEGLYRMNEDGNLEDNWSFFKKTGRYPTVPTVYQLNDEVANSFEITVNKSDYATRWSSISSKVDEFNDLFPQEYTGTLYAGRYENGWVTYNPYKTGRNASANIPFKYNTCEKMELTYSQYTAGVIKEYTDYLTIYLSNFDNELNPGLKTNTIKIYGSSSEPSYTITERGSNQISEVEKEWSEGVLTLTINQNGPLDIRVDCSGDATGRLTEYQTANIEMPASPPVYIGSRQYESETFEYKNISGIVKSGSSGSIRNYTGQGYLQFGTNASASVRDIVTVLNDGIYTLETKYAVTGGDVNTIDLYVNGTKVATPSFVATTTLSNWAVNSQQIELHKGANAIEFKANATGAQSIYFDNMLVSTVSTEDIWLEAECGTMGSLWEKAADSDASNNKYVTVQAGNNSTTNAPEDASGHISFEFTSEEAGDYKVWARVKTPTTEDNAFWVKMNDEAWFAWNDITTSTSWNWVEVNTFTLTAGEHTFILAYNEDGTQLDKLLITKSGTVPSEVGGTASNCSTVNQLPFAYAGLDKKITDSDDNGIETIVLDGNGSVDPDGEIVSYIWTEDGNEIATGVTPTVELSVGEHSIKLTVTDNEGAVDADDIIIRVYEYDFEASNIWLEAECGTVGANWDVIKDAEVSGGSYVTAKAGMESTGQAPNTDDGLIHIPFTIVSEDSYAVYGRVNCPSYEDDSFWLKMDNGSFSNYNGLKSNGWEWYKFGDFDLSEGEHELTIGYREDGALLDKFYITKNADLPEGIGEKAVNDCNNVSVGYIKRESFSLWQNFPNPFSTSTTIKYSLEKPENVYLKIYNVNGQLVKTIVNQYQSIGEYAYVWYPEQLPAGVYFYKLRVGEFSETRKMIIQK